MKTKQVITSIVALALTLAVSATSIGLNSVDVQAAKASTMKVESFEGKVTLKNSKGKAKTIKTGTRLLSGDNLVTKTESTANILLDDTKAALVEASSQVSVKQSGKDLDLIVDKGSVFFDVSKKLTSKESFEIKTSNIVCGIRGTIGEVRVKANKKKKLTQASVYLLEGKVTVKYQASKKKKKNKTIKAGQKLVVTNNTKTGKCVVKTTPITSTDIKKAVAEKLQADEILMSRVQAACPDIEWTTTIADALEGKNESVTEPFPEEIASGVTSAIKDAYKEVVDDSSKVLSSANYYKFSKGISKYILADVNGDEVPELLMEEKPYSQYEGLFYVISYKNGKAYLFSEITVENTDWGIVKGKLAAPNSSYNKALEVKISKNKCTYGNTIKTLKSYNEWKEVRTGVYTSKSDIKDAIDKL